MPKGRLVQAGVRARAAVRERTALPRPARLALGRGGALALLAVPATGRRQAAGVHQRRHAACSIFLSLGLLVWTSGQVSLCHAAFAGVGAAAFGQLTTQLHVPWALALVLAGVVTVPVGAIVAIPAIRLSGLYLALATFGFGILAPAGRLPASSLLFGAGGTRARAPARDQLARQRHRLLLRRAGRVVLACLLVWAVYHSRLGLLLRGLADSPLALSHHGHDDQRSPGCSSSASRPSWPAWPAASSAGRSATSAAFGFGPFESLTWLTVLAVAGTSQFGAAFVAAGLLAVAPAYVPERLERVPDPGLRCRRPDRVPPAAAALRPAGPAAPGPPGGAPAGREAQPRCGPVRPWKPLPV